jgi:small-conductance mechanosensitive channel
VRNIGISLLASAGFLTAMIGIAAQKTLFSLFSGIQIAFSQIIKIGDLVLVNNESGIIEEITFTFVTLKLGDRRRLIIPISQFVEKPFENWSRDEEGIRSSLLFYVDYRMPIEPLRDELDRILTTSEFWDKNAKKLQVANLKERSVELRIQVSAKNADDLSDLKADVREKMLAFIRENYPRYLPRIQLNGDGGESNILTQ